MLNHSGRSVMRGALLLSAALLPIMAIGAVAPAYADDQGVETVTVTAEKRSQNIESVPASITAFSGNELEAQGITDFSDIARMVPNVTLSTANNLRNTSINIRGQGTSPSNPALEPDTSLFIDGVYIAAAAPILNTLSDIQDIEVLRGPQGTLYGRNSPVGDVNVTTRAPTQDMEAFVDAEIGNYGERKVTGYFGGGITDDLAGRISLYTDSNSGYVKNLFNGEMTNDADNYGGRARLRWTPDSATTVDFIAYYNYQQAHGIDSTQVRPYAEGGIIGLIGSATPSYCTTGHAVGSTCAAGFGNYNFQTAWDAAYPGTPYRVPGNFQTDDGATGEFGTDAMYGASVQVNRELPFGATLSDILAYNFVNDDVKNLSVNGLPGYVFLSDGQYTRTGSESNELRIVSPGNQFVDYVAGLYMFHEDLIYDNLGQAGGPFLTPSIANGTYALDYFDQHTNGIAPYAQVTVHPVEHLRVIGGIRYSDDEKGAGYNAYNELVNGTHCTTGCAFVNAAVNPTESYQRTFDNHALTWLGTLQYDVTDNVMAYYTMANGFKDNGFQVRPYNPSTPDPAISAGPEHTLNYEVGTKAVLFDDKLLLNVDAYRMLIDGRQANLVDPAGVGTTFILVNAGIVHQNGVEMDLKAHPWEPLTINGNLSYTDAVFASFPNAPCISGYPFAGAAVPAGLPQPNPAYANKLCNQTGFTPPVSPKWLGNLNARWEQPWQNTRFLHEQSVPRCDARPAVFPGGLQPVRRNVGCRAERRQLESRHLRQEPHRSGLLHLCDLHGRSRPLQQDRAGWFHSGGHDGLVGNAAHVRRRGQLQVLESLQPETQGRRETAVPFCLCRPMQDWKRLNRLFPERHHPARASASG
jgi:iron complex outermembrane receptor protein